MDFSVRRIVPDIVAHDFERSKLFYSKFLGLELRMDFGWIQTFVSKTQATTQISILSNSLVQPQPSITIEVSDVAIVFARAVTHDIDVISQIQAEPYGVKHFLVRDPNGILINIMSHDI